MSVECRVFGIGYWVGLGWIGCRVLGVGCSVLDWVRLGVRCWVECRVLGWVELTWVGLGVWCRLFGAGVELGWGGFGWV